MTKFCGLCNLPIKTDDIVIALVLARFSEKDDGYELSPMKQTISSHLVCAENKPIETKEEPK